jgi:hypothetical protein
MEQLIEQIVASTGINPAIAHQAVGMILGYLQKNTDHSGFGDLLNAIPGSHDAIAQHGAEADQGGGLMGKLGGVLSGLGGPGGGGLGGMLGGAGGLMGLAAALQGKGLDMNQMKSIGEAIFNQSSAQIGKDQTVDIFKSIPGLGQMLAK